MLVWCVVLFFLGVAAFLDSLFYFGEIFRKVNSVLFMLISLGLLVRVSTKAKMRVMETLQEKIKSLEEKLKEKETSKERTKVS
jgi:hypothetical protein